MPRARYDGPSHVFQLKEGEEGIKKGAIGNFPAAVIDRYSKEENGGHRWTPESDLKPAAVAEAKKIGDDDTVPVVEERNVMGAKSGT